jgi:hypothetical protein
MCYFLLKYFLQKVRDFIRVVGGRKQADRELASKATKLPEALSV